MIKYCSSTVHVQYSFEVLVSNLSTVYLFSANFSTSSLQFRGKYCTVYSTKCIWTFLSLVTLHILFKNIKSNK